MIGFATEAGGVASHTAIVAAALEIPAVVGLGRALDLARTARSVIIDGDSGLVVLDPDAATLERYRKASAERTARFAGLADLAHLPAETLDGHRIELWGNIEFPTEVEPCHDRGATGVGPLPDRIPLFERQPSPHRGGTVHRLRRRGPFGPRATP